MQFTDRYAAVMMYIHDGLKLTDQLNKEYSYLMKAHLVQVVAVVESDFKAQNSLNRRIRQTVARTRAI